MPYIDKRGRVRKWAIHRPVAERFWEHVTPTDGCWEWRGSRNTKGYGVIRTMENWVSTTHAAHRVSYEVHHGPVPNGLWVLHRCDNPPCVNPAHLYLGTPADNVRDRDVRGRNGVAKVTAEQVRELRRRRAAGETLAVLASDYGISISQTCSIAKGRDWHLD